MSLVPMINIPFMLFGGFFSSQSTVPYYFYPFQYLSMFKYGYQAAVEVIIFLFINHINYIRMNSETLYITIVKILML